MEADESRKVENLTTIIRVLRDRLDPPGHKLALCSGVVIDVDIDRQEVMLDVTRGEGARLRMKFAIFDAASLSVSNLTPKGTVELTFVGERSSTARIITAENSRGAIQTGDIWYVTDVRYRCGPVDPSESTEVTRQQVRFEQRMGQAIKESRQSGIRPMPIHRLLNFLRYDMSPPTAERSKTEE